MIEDYRALAIFVAVARFGSFSAAGRQLRLSTSVVSHHVSKLEAKFGTSLFFRSTRSLSLTADGRAILDSAKRMVAAGEEALDALSEDSEQPVGALRITLPAFGGNTEIHRALWSFAEQHPMVALALHGSDKRVDIVKEGIDLAVRLGRLSDSQLISRRIGSFKRVLVAAPRYLATKPLIQTIDELRACDFVSLTMISDEISLVRDGEQISFEIESSRIELDSISTAKTAVLAGLGIQHLPLSEIEEELKNGSLVRVLPEWDLPVMGIYAVWSDGGPQKRLTRRLINFLIDALNE